MYRYIYLYMYVSVAELIIVILIHVRVVETHMKSMNSQKLNHVGEQIVMCQHDALRFARCAGAVR